MPNYQRQWLDHRYKPPYGVVEVDWGHSLAMGLVDLWLFNEAGGLAQNMASPANQLLQNGAVTRNAAVSGLMAAFPGTASDYFQTAITPADASYTGAISLCWRGVITVTSAQFLGKHVSNGAANNPFDFRTDTSATPQLDIVRANAGGYREWKGGAISLGILHTLVATQQAGAIEATPTMYIDGAAISVTSPGGSGSGAATGTTAAIRCGVHPDAATFITNGWCELAAIWSRQLTQVEAQILTADPYAMLRPITARRYILNTHAVALSYRRMGMVGGFVG